MGYIYDPSIHSPKNVTNEWILSLHVSSPRDGEPPLDLEAPLPAASFAPEYPSTQRITPYRRVVITRSGKSVFANLRAFSLT